MLLLEEFNKLNLTDMLHTTTQIAVQCREDTPVNAQLHEGCNSLVYDWAKYNPTSDIELPKKEKILQEKDFTVICDLFKNTYIEHVINMLNAKHKVWRGRFMMIKYKTCLSSHTDDTSRIHIPIITNPYCFMVIDDRIYKMKTNTVYIANTTSEHTAVNAGRQDRIHLVFCTDTKE